MELKPFFFFGMESSYFITKNYKPLARRADVKTEILLLQHYTPSLMFLEKSTSLI